MGRIIQLVEKLAAPEQPQQGAFDVMVVGIGGVFARNHDEVPAGFGARQDFGARYLTQFALDAVADDCVSDSFADGESEA